MHVIEIDYPILECEDGLILGNGDLSVSIYQKSDSIVWRFGKNDVWDRRLDLSDCPTPTHIDEMAKGIRDEGWVSHGYVYGEGESTRGKVSDPKRMKEICDGWPAYAMRPYPCPKPVGEVSLHLPTDQHRLKVTQRLTIEKGEAEITSELEFWVRVDGVLLDLLCRIFHPILLSVLTKKFDQFVLVVQQFTEKLQGNPEKAALILLNSGTDDRDVAEFRRVFNSP